MCTADRTSHDNFTDCPQNPGPALFITVPMIPSALLAHFNSLSHTSRIRKKKALIPFTSSSSSSCSVGWKQVRIPSGCQENENHSCSQIHWGSVASQLRSCLTWAPRRRHCLGLHGHEHCLPHFLAALFSPESSSREVKHSPRHLEREYSVTKWRMHGNRHTGAKDSRIGGERARAG